MGVLFPTFVVMLWVIKDGFSSGWRELTTCLLLLEHIGLKGCWATSVPTAPVQNQWGTWHLRIMCWVWVWVFSALLLTWAQRLKTLWKGKKIQNEEICRSWSPFELKKNQTQTSCQAAVLIAGICLRAQPYVRNHSALESNRKGELHGFVDAHRVGDRKRSVTLASNYPGLSLCLHWNTGENPSRDLKTQAKMAWCRRRVGFNGEGSQCVRAAGSRCAGRGGEGEGRRASCLPAWETRGEPAPPPLCCAFSLLMNIM